MATNNKFNLTFFFNHQNIVHISADHARQLAGALRTEMIQQSELIETLFDSDTDQNDELAVPISKLEV